MSDDSTPADVAVVEEGTAQPTELAQLSGAAEVETDIALDESLRAVAHAAAEIGEIVEQAVMLTQKQISKSGIKLTKRK